MSLLSRKTELYEWSRGTTYWRYTSGDRAATFNQQTYAPAAIKRSALADTQESAKNKLDITVPLSLPLLQQWRGGGTPSEEIKLTVYQLRGGMVSIVWRGVLANPTFSDREAVLHHLPPAAAAARIGLTPPWSKTCHKVLYSAGLGGCNASLAGMRVDGTLTAVAGKVMQAAAWAGKPDGWFERGFVMWATATGTERRAIVSHAGDTLTLLTPAGATAGTVVSAYPGCDQTALTCRDKFHNIDNFGGFAWLPSKNPFGSDPLY